MGDYLVLKCPHCNDLVFIYLSELNCRIFRHGVFKKGFVGVYQHSTKAECEQYVKDDLIVGCGKPFLIDETLNAVVCDYI